MLMDFRLTPWKLQGMQSKSMGTESRVLVGTIPVQGAHCASSCVTAQHHRPRAKLNTDHGRQLGGCLLLLTCSQPCYSSHSCAETYWDELSQSWSGDCGLQKWNLINLLFFFFLRRWDLRRAFETKLHASPLTSRTKPPPPHSVVFNLATWL